MLNAELEIKQHNQYLSLLLGYRDGKLTGRHLSSILNDDTLIRHLLSSDNSSGWFQGECILKMSTDRPLVARFRAGPVVDEDPSLVRREIIDIIYEPSENRFLPYSSRSPGKPKNGLTSAAAPKSYVLIFRESQEAQHLSHQRRIRAMQFLLNAVSERVMEPQDILLNFARVFDSHAEVTLLPSDFGEGDTEKESHFLLPPQTTEAALEAAHSGNTVMYYGENTWCFFPVRSQHDVHGIACIQFAVPRLNDEEDKQIFNLAGKALGAYIENYTLDDQAVSVHPLFEIVTDAVDHPIIMVNRDGIITLCNAAAQEIYGRTAPEMIGKSFGHLVFPANSPVQYEDMLDRVLRGDSLQYEEMLHICGDFTDVSVSLAAYPYRLNTGPVIGGIFIMRDLGEKRRLWDKIMQWEKLAALGEMLSNVANELNNPLTSLTGYAYLLLNRDDNKNIDDMASTIYEEARRCSDVVHGVLELAHRSEEQKGYSHVNDMIIAALNLKHRQLRSSNINVRMDLGESIPGIVADPHNMERLFLRLINYSERRMVEYDNGGLLTLESALEDGKIIVRFMDTGACVLRDDIAEISDPFFTAGEDEGAGLGLSISCQILSDIGGSIHIDSEIGKGNTFTIELPAAEEMAPDTVDRKIETLARSQETGKRVLVVDDEPAIVELIVELLQQMGHVADIAGDGNEAMKKVENETYDLIIADLRMPSGYTGDRLHKFLEIKNPELAQYTIFITGDVINPETRRFLQNTGNPYLEKPFLPESLQEVIETALSRQELTS